MFTRYTYDRQVYAKSYYRTTGEYFALTSHRSIEKAKKHQNVEASIKASMHQCVKIYHAEIESKLWAIAFQFSAGIHYPS